jgi:large subunit ribosomal protein L3
MAGHMGATASTMKKVRVVRADAERNLLLLAGPLPGARGAVILVRKA